MPRKCVFGPQNGQKGAKNAFFLETRTSILPEILVWAILKHLHQFRLKKLARFDTKFGSYGQNLDFFFVSFNYLVGLPSEAQNVPQNFFEKCFRVCPFFCFKTQEKCWSKNIPKKLARKRPFLGPKWRHEISKIDSASATRAYINIAWNIGLSNFKTLASVQAWKIRPIWYQICLVWGKLKKFPLFALYNFPFAIPPPIRNFWKIFEIFFRVCLFFCCKTQEKC